MSMYNNVNAYTMSQNPYLFLYNKTWKQHTTKERLKATQIDN